MEKCPNCNEDIEDGASYCPFCHRALIRVSPSESDDTGSQEEKKPGIGAFGAILIGLVVLIAVLMTYQYFAVARIREIQRQQQLLVTVVPTADVGDKITAAQMCKQFMSDRLKAPSQAEFQNAFDAAISQSGNYFTVDSYVDAPNALGVMLRTAYTCKIKYTGSNEWELQALEIEP